MSTAYSDTFQNTTLALPFVVHSFGLSDRGRVRSSNEDRFLIMEVPRTMDRNPPGHIFLVADGMGGHPGGEVAATFCRKSFRIMAVVKMGATGL